MAYSIILKTHSDKRGNLTVIEKEIPFDIKRIFYIYGVDDSARGEIRSLDVAHQAFQVDVRVLDVGGYGLGRHAHIGKGKVVGDKAAPAVGTKLDLRLGHTLVLVLPAH